MYRNGHTKLPRCPEYPGKKRYHALSGYFRRLFGHPVFKISIDAGFSCPNRDGSIHSEGCSYCDNTSFSPGTRHASLPVEQQIETARAVLTRRYDASHFLAYFQAFTNTYAPLDRLRELYERALACPGVVGLSIGTRPDSLPDDVLDYLARLKERCHLWLELGLQSASDRSLELIGRGHTFADFCSAVERCHQRGIRVATHLILGLPGEDRDQMVSTSTAVAGLGIEGVKFHLLLVVRGTRLAAMHEEGTVRLLGRKEYVGIICDCLEVLPQQTVIHRLQGDCPPHLLLAPSWALDKQGILRDIEAELEARNSWQSRSFISARQDPFFPEKI